MFQHPAFYCLYRQNNLDMLTLQEETSNPSKSSSAVKCVCKPKVYRGFHGTSCSMSVNLGNLQPAPSHGVDMRETWDSFHVTDEDVKQKHNSSAWGNTGTAGQSWESPKPQSGG